MYDQVLNLNNTYFIEMLGSLVTQKKSTVRYYGKQKILIFGDKVLINKL